MRPPRRGTRPPISRAQRGREEKARLEKTIGVDSRWVVGIHSCEEVLRVRPARVRQIQVKADYEESKNFNKIVEMAKLAGLTPLLRTPQQLETIGHGHQGVAVLVQETPELDWESLKEESRKLVIILDGIEDPQNLGAILRTGWLVDCAAILIPKDRAVGLTPAVCKIASGGAEHVPVARFANLPAAIKQLKDSGFWIYGLSEKGQKRAWDFQLPQKIAWVVGAEGEGLRITTERVCDELVRIPQVESGSSYNASIALAMALAETCRQQGIPQ